MCQIHGANEEGQKKKKKKKERKRGRHAQDGKDRITLTRQLKMTQNAKKNDKHRTLLKRIPISEQKHVQTLCDVQYKQKF